MSYPEHSKLSKIADESQAIGEFLEWLGDCGYLIAEHGDGAKTGPGDEYEYGHNPHRLYAARRSIEEWLAEFFEIDRDKIEAEKRAMLDAQRELNERTG